MRNAVRSDSVFHFSSLLLTSLSSRAMSTPATPFITHCAVRHCQCSYPGFRTRNHSFVELPELYVIKVYMW